MINQSTAEGHHVLHCAPKCWSRLMLCNWKLAHKKRVHAAVHRQSDWSNRKYSLSVPTRPSSTSRLAVGREGKGREGRDVPTRMIPQVPKAPQAPPKLPSNQAPLHSSGPCSCRSTVPARRVSTLGGTAGCALCLSPPPLPSLLPLPLPPFLGAPGLDPTTKERTRKGQSQMCIAPSRRHDPNTLAVHCITSHRTRNPNTKRQLDTTYPHLVKSLRPAHVASTCTCTPTPARRHASHMTEPPTAPYRRYSTAVLYLIDPTSLARHFIHSFMLSHRPTPPQEPPLVVINLAQLAAPSAYTHARAHARRDISHAPPATASVVCLSAVSRSVARLASPCPSPSLPPGIHHGGSSTGDRWDI